MLACLLQRNSQFHFFEKHANWFRRSFIQLHHVVVYRLLQWNLDKGGMVFCYVPDESTYENSDVLVVDEATSSTKSEEDSKTTELPSKTSLDSFEDIRRFSSLKDVKELNLFMHDKLSASQLKELGMFMSHMQSLEKLNVGPACQS